MHKTMKEASVGDRRQSVVVAGMEPGYAEVTHMQMSRGRFISSTDVLMQRAVCVITESLRLRLFGYRDPIGKTVLLTDVMHKPFVVIGVIDALPQALLAHGGESGNCVLIPLSTDTARFGELTVNRSQGSRTMERVQVSQCILQMSDEQAVLAAAPIVRHLLERFHDQTDYEVRVPVEEIQLLKKDRQRWNFMFFMIASVSLLVGGIGIMNIMLASVTERTREIGIRRALGAKRRDIIVQFLVESVTLTAIGGLLGIAIGLGVPAGVEYFLKFTTLVTPATLIVPFVMAVAVGLLSGLYPAMRAARLDPIEALRHE
jgi:putative ABC transport system permease protein